MSRAGKPISRKIPLDPRTKIYSRVDPLTGDIAGNDETARIPQRRRYIPGTITRVKWRGCGCCWPSGKKRCAICAPWLDAEAAERRRVQEPDRAADTPPDGQRAGGAEGGTGALAAPAVVAAVVSVRGEVRTGGGTCPGKPTLNALKSARTEKRKPGVLPAFLRQARTAVKTP